MPGSLMCIRPWSWSPLSSKPERTHRKSLSEQEERLSELETALQAQQAAFNELVDKLSHEDCRGTTASVQQAATPPADTLTNC